MKALVAHGAGDLRIEDREAREPGSGEVLIRMTHGGICGSDLHYYKEGRVGAFAITEPLVLGHEVAGRVERDGRASDDPNALPVGTPVTLHPASYDRQNPEFDPARPTISPGARYLGSAATTPHTQGGFSEFVTARTDQVRVLPEGLPLSRGVLAEPLGVGLHAIARAGGVDGRRVLISGSGPIGLLALRAAVLAGATEVWASDVLERPLALARQLGAAGTVALRSEQVPTRAFDVVIEAAGVPAATSTAIRAVRSGGVVVQVGMVPGTPEPYALAELVSREIDLRGAFRFDTEIDTAIEMLARDPLFDLVVTHSFAADDAVAAFAVAADSAVSSKVVLRLWGAEGED
ncbi:zinc-binding dehydrogenase [Galbitalea soli]|uniref:Alcohol dehydrogenase catalytic domain-containing protein n=1 Tax=Galbitalea soli TaxID=1268042 RepID=A0A7C9TQY2_9MICO|nr:zinc-binding dehydrogenase [Galbitalea soli]NEM90944.1 alcohol dehydrogenase catalytic domain-containing protein [Galbitalea soli]NYJ29631.1 L-idonate 5-dehydrogenase [Galbitalea soli]